MTDEEIEQAARYEVRVCRGDFFLPRICNRRNGLDFTKHIGNKGKRNRPERKDINPITPFFVIEKLRVLNKLKRPRNPLLDVIISIG